MLVGQMIDQTLIFFFEILDLFPYRGVNKVFLIKLSQIPITKRLEESLV